MSALDDLLSSLSQPLNLFQLAVLWAGMYFALSQRVTPDATPSPWTTPSPAMGPTACAR